MGIIHVLPPQMANLIAAGEVVERPGSVVKEIIENAVDSGADRIEVEIRQGGVTYIRVTDNGCGMEADDLPRAFLRHATSKIRTPEDMQAIGTMGFRGEALAAISSVSRMDIFTRTAQSISGWQMTCEGGETSELRETGCPKGTTVVVRDLFYNVPARMKFLKKDATEGAYCENAVVSAALANPGISFKLIRDGRECFFSAGGGQLLKVIGALCPRETVAALLPIHGVFQGGEIHGYISPVGETRSSRSMQYFLVNGRPVRGKLLSSAIDGAYKGRIMPGRYPICFLEIRVPLSAVDVNVHPAKLEVRFAREKDIFSLIRNAIAAALDHAVGFPELDLPPVREEEPAAPTPAAAAADDVRPSADAWPPAVVVRRGPDGVLTADEDKMSAGVDFRAPAARARVTDDFELEESMFNINKLELLPRRPAGSPPPMPARPKTPAGDVIPMPPAAVQPEPAAAPSDVDVTPDAQQHMEGFEGDGREAAENAALHVIGMAFGTYILVQQGEDLWMIDKHAAHEKLIYNRLRAQMGQCDTQILLQPVSVSLTAAEKQACLDHLQLLARCGFELEDLGLPGLVVRGAPTYLRPEDIAFVLSEMAGKLAQGTDTDSTVLDDLLASIACKAAVKGGSDSDAAELQRLAQQVLSLPDVRNCPHGRPVAVRMSRRQLEKQFKRVL